MNYYDARERRANGSGTGIWEYTQMNDGYAWPIGYCHEWMRDQRPDWMDDASWAERVKWMDEEEATGRMDLYHGNGHVSKEAAYACYKRFCLDHYLRIDMTVQDVQHQCIICKAWTQRGASMRGPMWENWWLCQAHLNQKAIEPLFAVGYCASSY